ncbi:MAG: HAD hydrolase-like protein [Corynebacterium sp.]|nr:HAD hydrolase-like protein [Corynebacterium sp.]
MTNPQTQNLLLLDVDGTLIDSFPGIVQSFLHALDDVSWPAPPDEVIGRIAGPPMEETLRSLGMDAELVPVAFHRYLHHYGQSGWRNARAYPGAVDFLTWAHEEGIVVATATSKGEGFARTALTEFGLIGGIDVLAAAQENGPRRTKRQVLDYAREQLTEKGVWGGPMALVGDRIHDVDGALYAGATAIAATWGYGFCEEWAEADYQAANFDEVKEILRARVFHL